MAKSADKKSGKVSIENMEHVRSPEHRYVYANHVAVMHTPLDIVVHFGGIDVRPGGTPRIVNEVSVRLSPAVALALINAITTRINENMKDFVMLEDKGGGGSPPTLPKKRRKTAS